MKKVIETNIKINKIDKIMKKNMKETKIGIIKIEIRTEIIIEIKIKTIMKEIEIMMMIIIIDMKINMSNLIKTIKINSKKIILKTQKEQSPSQEIKVLSELK